MALGDYRNRQCRCGKKIKYKNCHWQEDVRKELDKFPNNIYKIKAETARQQKYLA